MAGPIRISILANASQARREISSVANETSSMGSKLGRIGKVLGTVAVAGLAVAGAGAAVVKFGADSVKAASDAQQSLGATQTVFGKFADTVIKTSDNAATKYGLSANVYRENANLIGSLFKNQGVSLDELGGKTEKMIGIGADLAATFGGTTTDAVNALGAAYKGEYDQLERYGISLKQSDVNARLAAKGQDNLTGSALKAAEQQAKTDLIMQQSAQTNGAFARESNTLAHQQQVLGAQFDNLKAKVGTALLPVLTTLLTFLNANLVPAFTAVGNFLRPLVEQFQAFFAGLGQGNGKVSQLATFFTTQVVPAVQGVISAFQGYLAVVIPIIRQVAQAVMSGWSQIQPQVKSIWTSVKNIIVNALSIVKSVVQVATRVISAVWQRFGGTILRFITSTMKNVATVLKGAFQIIEGLFQVVSSALRGDWSGLWNGIKKIVSGAISVVKGIVSQGFNVVRTVTSAAWNAMKAVVARAWDGIENAVSSGIQTLLITIRLLPGKITGALGSLGSLLYNAGKDIIQGLLNGIDSMIGSVKSKLGGLTDLIPKVKGPPKRDKVLLYKNGRLIMKGLVRGLDDGSEEVKGTLGKLTDLIGTYLDKRFDGKVLARHTRSVMKSLKDEYNALKRNAKAQDAVTEKLKTARETYKSLADAAVAYGSVMGLGANEDGSVSIASTIDQLRNKVANAKRFGALIAQLTADGLNNTTLQQIISAGVEGGLATAEALASGGQSALAEINSLTAEMKAAGNEIGDAAVGGIIDGLEKQSDRLGNKANRMANALVKAVKRALGINSPSKVFAGLGGEVVKGLSIGLDETYVKRSGAVLAASLQKGFGNPALSADARTASQNKMTVTLTAEQVSALQRGREIQMDLDAYKASGGRVRA